MNSRKRKLILTKKNNDSGMLLKIETLNESGVGVTFYKKLKILVEKTLPGEEVLVDYDPQRPRKKRIRLQKIINTSPERRKPPCSYFKQCGGCHLQHLAYPAHLIFKQQQIQQQVAQTASLKEITVHPVEGMPEPFSYRNKSQLPYQYQKDQVVFGLYRSRSHELIPVEQCLIESRDANQAFQIVRQWAAHYQISIYNEVHHEGLLRHVMVRKGLFTNQLMVVAVVTQREIPYLAQLLQSLKAGLSSLRSVQININPEKTNVILGEENILAWGDPFIEERLGQRRFRIYPATFFQINTVQMVKLLEKMGKLVKLKSTDSVIDLFCGVGAISLHIAGKVQEVTGIEMNREAINAALQNTLDNNVKNVRFLDGDASEAFRHLQEQGFSSNVVIVDPPRKGLPIPLIGQISAMAPRNIVYISCNPRTLIRDLEEFQKQGYQTKEIFPFDMFPQTYHVESLVVLHRQVSE